MFFQTCTAVQIATSTININNEAKMTAATLYWATTLCQVLRMQRWPKKPLSCQAYGKVKDAILAGEILLYKYHYYYSS